MSTGLTVSSVEIGTLYSVVIVILRYIIIVFYYSIVYYTIHDITPILWLIDPRPWDFRILDSGKTKTCQGRFGPLPAVFWICR